MDRRALWLGVLCAVLPDIDVVGFGHGIQYGDLWGHRGLTHSLIFAALLSAGFGRSLLPRASRPVRAGMGLYFFLSAVSHGLLDAMTDGGLGIAFFSPFDTTRYFFSVRPIAVSPIGIHEFFSEQGLMSWPVKRMDLAADRCPVCGLPSPETGMDDAYKRRDDRLRTEKSLRQVATRRSRVLVSNRTFSADQLRP